MTSIMAPSLHLKFQYENLFTQMGATKVQTDGPYNLNLTYTNNGKANNAEALLKDEVFGAKLVIDNQSTTRDFPRPSAEGIANILRGVANLEVSVATPKCGDGNTIVMGSSADEVLVNALRDIVNTSPEQGIEVSLFHKPAAEPAG